MLLSLTHSLKHTHTHTLISLSLSLSLYLSLSKLTGFRLKKQQTLLSQGRTHAKELPSRTFRSVIIRNNSYICPSLLSGAERRRLSIGSRYSGALRRVYPVSLQVSFSTICHRLNVVDKMEKKNKF